MKRKSSTRSFHDLRYSLLYLLTVAHHERGWNLNPELCALIFDCMCDSQKKQTFIEVSIKIELSIDLKIILMDSK